MRQFLGWIGVVVSCAVGAAAAQDSANPRLQEARQAFEAAKAFDETGRYAEAVVQGERALALREAVLGEKSPEVATCLDLLGGIHRHEGSFDQAELLIQRGLSLREATLGTNHPDVAQSLNNLAHLYAAQGLYERARPLHTRALAIREAALGANHPDVAQSLNNLAILYNSQGRYSRAEPLLVRALAIREAAFGPNHPEVAKALYNLANLRKDQGLYSQAEPLYQRALTIYEAALGDNHPLVAVALDGLADLYRDQGMYPQAESLYRRALAIDKALLGNAHPLVAGLINDIALSRLAQQRLDEALPLFTRAFALSEGRLRKEALDFSEERLASFLQFLRSDEERLYALLRAYPEDARVRRLALGAALLLKGRSLEETADISRFVYRGLGQRDLEAFERLRDLRGQIASLSLDTSGSLSSEEYSQRLKDLAEQRDALEASLARRSAPLRAQAALPSLEAIVDEVAAALPRDGSLVEFIAYTDRPLVPSPGTPKSRLPNQLRYLAVVLLPDASTRAVDLGPAEPIEQACLRLRNAMANRDAAFQALAQDVYRRVFQPLLPVLGHGRRLLLAPDGQLALVPFDALHDGTRFLIDAYDITYLTSGKDLLPRAAHTAVADSVVVLADPDFKAPARALPDGAADIGAVAQRSASLEQLFSTLSRDVAERTWVPLPGTRQEAEAIQRLVPRAQVFLGSEATRQRLLRLPAPGILHLATHGFFLEDSPSPVGSRALGHFGALGEEPSNPRSPDPLLRSGLLFAGAGTRSASGAPQSSPDSAMVTALELAGLNLWGTQLVVLSACDTGRGDIKLGQGVYGLRRAFVVAGAETVVTSLWKVNDQTTSALMEAYYRNLLAGQGRATALREAMRWLRTTEPHPHEWAPFIALGTDARLRGLGSPP